MRQSLATHLLLFALALSGAEGAAAPATGDVVHLVDGRTLVGKIKRASAEQWMVTTNDHRTTCVATSDVASIDVTARPTTDPVAAGRRLDSLRRAVASVDDPAKAIDRYARLAEAGADPATLAKAQQDVAVWQDRLDHHLVRLGDRWVHPAAREQAFADALAYAGEARQLVKQGRFVEADPVLTATLSIDPRNASALYLQGLVRLQQNRLPAARTAFEAVAALLPDHGPTQVNLAVIAWQQGRFADALARYDAAMILAPANPVVLADVAAALSGDLPAAIGRSPVVTRVRQRFQMQSAQLADQMSKAGLHPFGAAWLTDAEMVSVRNAQQQDQVKLDALTGDFERVQDKIRETDLAIAEVETQMRRSASGSQPPPGPWLASYDGGDGPHLSSVFYDLGNDVDQLRIRRAKAVSQLDDLHRRAAAIRKRMAGDADGAQHPVGPEATPVRLPTP